MVVFVNIIRNLYELDKNWCEKLRRENIMKIWRKVDGKIEENIIYEFGVCSRVEKMV